MTQDEIEAIRKRMSKRGSYMIPREVYPSDVEALLVEVERLKLEASVWRRLHKAEGEVESVVNPMSRERADAVYDADECAYRGNFSAASKLLDEAGYKEGGT